MKSKTILFLVLIAFSMTAFAQEPAIQLSDKPGWHKIGEVKADFQKESESIAPMGKDEFKAVKLKITDGPIEISEIIVTYEDETMQKIPFNGTLASGAETKEYDLTSPEKELKKVSFTYRSQPNYRDKKAHVELYGLK
jgi:hypothetical protein